MTEQSNSIKYSFNVFSFPLEEDRPVGNKKGVLTRQRHPKRAAFVLRDRYMELAGIANTRNT